MLGYTRAYAQTCTRQHGDEASRLLYGRTAGTFLRASISRLLYGRRLSSATARAGVVLPSIDYGDLTAALSANAVAANLQPLPSFIEKAIQLYEMIVVRHGLMLVGRSFSMKTVAIKTLAAALGDLCAACEWGRGRDVGWNVSWVWMGVDGCGGVGRCGWDGMGWLAELGGRHDGVRQRGASLSTGRCWLHPTTKTRCRGLRRQGRAPCQDAHHQPQGRHHGPAVRPGRPPVQGVDRRRAGGGLQVGGRREGAFRFRAFAHVCVDMTRENGGGLIALGVKWRHSAG